MIIEDGTGSGYKAQVDSEHKLSTRAITERRFVHAAEVEQEAYVLTTPFLTITVAGGRILWMRNDSQTLNLYLERFNVSWDGGSASHDETVQISIYGGDGVPSANQTVVTPANLNIGSGNVADATCYYWDEVGNGMTVVAGDLLTNSQAAIGSSTEDTEGLIIAPNTAMSINLSADAEVGEASIIVLFYFHEAG